MTRVFHTPGSFGNYVAYLLDCKQVGHVRQSPFTASGSSHLRSGATKSYDIVLDAGNNVFRGANENDIAIHWDKSYFFLILHSAYGRTNSGQYGKCGVQALEENTYQWYNKHQGHKHKGNDLDDFLYNIEKFYDFRCDAERQRVPTQILQQYFFLHFVKYHENKLFIKNNELKTSSCRKLSIDVILDYESIKKYLGIDFDFSANHAEFLDRNLSLKAYVECNRAVDCVISQTQTRIDAKDVITKAGILYALEVYYYDIPFYNLNFELTNTQELIEYITSFPQYMKRPNRLFEEDWRIYNGK